MATLFDPRPDFRRALPHGRDMDVRLASFLLVLVLGASGACDQAPNQSKTDGGLAEMQPICDGGDTETQPEAGGGDAAPRCTQPLDAPQPWGGCAAHRDDPTWWASICAGFPPEVVVQSCKGFSLQSLTFGGTHGFACYYDDAGALIGAEFYDDIPTFCTQTDSHLVAGNVPALVGCYLPIVRHLPCPSAAGAD
jgi:hypothetical protein